MNKVDVPTYNIAKSIDMMAVSFKYNKEQWDKICDSLNRMFERKDYDLGI
jgi:hypothetical protein